MVIGQTQLLQSHPPLVCEGWVGEEATMNVVLIEDSIGDIVEIRNYCSDFCAKFDPNYDGWYGCIEAEYKIVCYGCAKKISE